MQDNPYDNGLLRTGMFAGLHFDQGWFFIQTLDTEYIELKPWILLNENETRGEIAAQTAGSEDDEFVDAQGRHYLIPADQEQDMVFQTQFGISPSRMQVYPFFGRDRAPNLEDAEPGTPEIPFSGYDSPYNNPNPVAEIFTVNSQTKPSLQAYNPMDEASEAKLSFHVNKIKYAVVEDMGLMRAMLQGNQPAKLHSMGLGAQKRDRISAPGWLMDIFGENVHTTQEIIGEDNGGQQPSGVQIPGSSSLS